MNQPAQPKKKTNPIVIVAVVLGALVVCGIAGVGVIGALGVSGSRKYLENSKRAEGMASSGAIARGVIACAEQEKLGEGTLAAGTTAKTGGLPSTTPAVPSDLSKIRGKKYVAAPTDWESPSWRCIKFSMMMPQYFQYQWVKENDTAGKVVAKADLNGDGSADAHLETPVTCSGGKCTAGKLTIVK